MGTHKTLHAMADERVTEPRIGSVDALRGLSLLGILVVNIAFLASGYRMAGLAEPSFDSGLDWGVRWLVTAFLENKFYLLFSFLFGYSFTLQLDSAVRQGKAFVPMFLRRVGGLLLIGAVHAVLLFPGDILTTYAVVGVALIILRRIRPRTAVILAVCLTGLLALGLVLLFVMSKLGADAAGTISGGAGEAIKADTELAGNALQIIGEHLRKFSLIMIMRVLFQGPAVLAACLIGVAVGKLGALRDLSAHTATLRKLQWTGFTLGLAGAFVYTYSVWSGGVHKFLGQAVDLVTAPSWRRPTRRRSCAPCPTSPGWRGGSRPPAAWPCRTTWPSR